MDAIQMQQMAVEARARRRRQLVDIGRALKLMDAGDYGYCESCGEEIDPRRLDFEPASSRCVSCAD